MKSSGCETIYEQFYFIKTEPEKRVKMYEQNNKKLPYFKSEYKSRWEKVHRVDEQFIEGNKNRSNASIIYFSWPV